jgi:hypothetical protein
MRMAIKRIFPAKKNHTLQEILPHQTISNNPLSVIFNGFQIAASESDNSKKMVELELERKQSSARTYVNLIPPR